MMIKSKLVTCITIMVLFFSDASTLLYRLLLATIEMLSPCNIKLFMMYNSVISIS